MRVIVILTALAINITAFAESPQLILVPTQTSIKPHSSVVCNLYLYKESEKTLSVPSFETIAMVYTLHDVAEARLPRGDSTALVTGHSSGIQSLKSHTIKQTKVTVDFSAEPGDLVELYVEIGRESI